MAQTGQLRDSSQEAHGPQVGGTVALQQELERGRLLVKTDTYAMSIGECISLYEREEIEIRPEYQHFFRWDLAQKSRLVESILLGIPIPPIFVAQRADGIWDVIDGLQRLSTIFEFAGVLKDEGGTVLPPLRLARTRYLPSLEGKRLGTDQDRQGTLDSPQRLHFKRARLALNIILPESDDIASYEMFQRLNTGGLNLSDQELRSATLVQANRELSAAVRELATGEDFRVCTTLSEKQLKAQYDAELAVRFLVLRRIDIDDLSGIGDMKEFLTDRIVAMAVDPAFDLAGETSVFRDTFRLLRTAAGADCFRRYATDEERFKGRFLVSAFEVFALGLGYCQPCSGRSPERVLQIIRAYWESPPPGLRAGSGVTTSSRLRSTVALGRRTFCDEYRNA